MRRHVPSHSSVWSRHTPAHWSRPLSSTMTTAAWGYLRMRTVRAGIDWGCSGWVVDGGDSWAGGGQAGSDGGQAFGVGCPAFSGLAYWTFSGRCW